MRARWLLLLAWAAGTPAVAELYKHVDEAGRVTYSDKPRHPDAQVITLPPPNVTTPEARRQLELARQRMDAEERAEYEARLRRWAGAQRAAPATSRGLSPSPRNYPASYPGYYPSSGYGYALPYYVGYARSPTPNHPSHV